MSQRVGNWQDSSILCPAGVQLFWAYLGAYLMYVGLGGLNFKHPFCIENQCCFSEIRPILSIYEAGGGPNSHVWAISSPHVVLDGPE